MCICIDYKQYHDYIEVHICAYGYFWYMVYHNLFLHFLDQLFKTVNKKIIVCYMVDLCLLHGQPVLLHVRSLCVTW